MVRNAGAARTAAEIFVATADSEVGLIAIEIEQHHAGGVREIPDRQSPRLMSECGDPLHVPQPPGAVVRVRQHHDGNVRAQRRFDFAPLH